MRIIDWPQFLDETPPPKEKPSVITVGIFDGVHRGHRALIEAVVSQKGRAIPTVITFRRGHHKRAPGGGKDYPGDILSFRQKTAIFESLGAALTVVVEFSDSFRRMSGTEFLRLLCERGRMGFMAVGSNFRCGYHLDTDVSAIQELNEQRNIETRVVEPLTEDGRPISSSQIRAAITSGKLAEAAAMLGRPFTVDLAGGASAISTGKTSGGRLVYDIAAEGRVLPPPGRYQVLLLGKDHARRGGMPAEITIEQGRILIAETNNAARFEYVEFVHAE